MMSNPNLEEIKNPEIWVDKYADYLYNYAFSRVNDEIAAEDLVQETFLAALRGMDRFTGSSTLKTWLISILKNKVIDYFRKKYRESKVEIQEDINFQNLPDFNKSGRWVGHWIDEVGPVEWSDPHKFMENKQFWETLDDCLSKLPIRLKSIFVLHQMEDINPKEICNEFKLTSTNLWVILHRSRKLLRKCMEVNWVSETPRLMENE